MAFDVAQKWVAEAEAALHIRLPNAYRDTLMSRNGGEIETTDEVWTAYAVLDRTDRRRLARSAMGLVAEAEAAHAWPRFPRDGIAIADNGSGDRLLFLRSRDGQCGDKVLAWDHETGDLKVIAQSFNELMIE